MKIFFRHKLKVVFISALLLVTGFSFLSTNHPSPWTSYHSQSRNLDSGEFFIDHKLCAGCHGYDSTHLANIDADSADVNVYDDWKSTMMALSAKDPLWRAKVSHEISVNPNHFFELQDKCTSCHAPLGHFTSLYHGNSHYTLSDLMNDTLGIDGISCMGCHTIGTEGLGSRFSGDIPFDTTRKIFGPFMNPFAGPMQLYVGVTPTYSEHMTTSPVCSSCHTLITNSADLSGNLTGGTFVEQATYHEYKNSDFPAQHIYCQTCHMPQLEEPVIIANQILALQGRSPFNLHQFAGANSFMLNLIKNNKSSLGITNVPDVDFDNTISLTLDNLIQKSVDLTLHQDSLTTDTAYFSVTLKNKTGHKFPSGYPSRRAVVQFVVLKSNGDTLFRSGIFGSDYEINYLSGPVEHHHDIIKSQSQSQIYELTMGDVNGNKTTVLERAANLLKDNRLVPSGFTTTHYDYDTVKLDNDALNDLDFNKSPLGIEGTGKDIVHFHISTGGYDGVVNVFAKIYYQSVPPGWLQEMFSYNTELIDSFKSMYQSADKLPVLCASDQLLNIQLLNGVNQISAKNFSVYPTASIDGIVTVSADDISSIEIFNSDGKLLSALHSINHSDNTIELPHANGIYFIRIHSGAVVKTFKVLRL